MEHREIAVVGSGIAGLSAAWLLARKHRVTLYEAAPYLGGHTNTVDVTVAGKTFPVDTGFLVFNERTYPNLIGMLDHLGVASTASEMSFSVSLQQPEVEWSGTNLSTVFGQRRNLLRPDFWRMVADILRFNQSAVRWLDRHPDESGPSLGGYLAEHRYSAAFRDWYLLPMAAAIWSCPTGQMLDYPFATFVRFCRNHGLLQLENRPRWRTVMGGAREYVKKLAAGIPRIHLDAPVLSVRRSPRGVEVAIAGEHRYFNDVVMACHSDQALRILGDAATPAEREILGAVRYQPNRAILHTDASILPRDRSLWSAWNYRAEAAVRDVGDPARPNGQPVSVSYLINKLQPLPVDEAVIVTLNPRRPIDPAKTIAEFDYAHPVFDGPAIAAQSRLNTIQDNRGLWFCGAWTGYGFHEDGLKAGMRVARDLGCPAPWLEDRSRTHELAMEAA